MVLEWFGILTPAMKRLTLLGKIPRGYAIHEFYAKKAFDLKLRIRFGTIVLTTTRSGNRSDC